MAEQHPTDLPNGLRLTVEDDPSRADRRFIDDALDAMNEPYFGNTAFGRIGVFIRDQDGTVQAGLDALIEAGWLYIDNLWIAEGLRRRGIGRRLMDEAERIARARECHSAWVDTFSFQAPGFYEKLGYAVFATLDYPPNHRRIFLKKSLAG